MCLLSQSVRRPCGVSVLIRQLSVPKTVNISRKMQKTLGVGFKPSCSSAESWPQTCPFWPGDVSEAPRTWRRSRCFRRSSSLLILRLTQTSQPITEYSDKQRLYFPLKLSAALLFTRLHLFIESIAEHEQRTPRGCGVPTPSNRAKQC